MHRIDDLLLAFLQHRDLHDVLRGVTGRADLSESFDLDRIGEDLAVLEATRVAEFPTTFTTITAPLPAQLRRLYWFRYVVARVVSTPLEQAAYDHLASVLDPADELAHALLRVCRVSDGWRSERDRCCHQVLEGVITRVERQERTVGVAYVESMAHHSLGHAWQELGNFRDAERNFARASEIAQFYDFYTKHIYQSAFAKLCWASGQYRRALELHSDGETRRAARSAGDTTFLIDSHLCAAKCAIDLGTLARAEQELELAKSEIDSSVGTAVLATYYTFFSAQLEARRGEPGRARAAFERCAARFRSMSPRCAAGVLDAQLELIALNVRDCEYRTAFGEIERLLRTAEERGVMEARSRLLAFQAHLYLDRDAPLSVLRGGYDDLVERLHLMNNPRLTFLAYADLYAFAREHLDKREQKFWLLRIRALEPVLERSCYETLYRDYVTERYRAELERELETFERDLENLQA